LTVLLVNSKLVFGSCDWSERTERGCVAQLANSNNHRHSKTNVAAASKRRYIALQCAGVYLKLFCWFRRVGIFFRHCPHSDAHTIRYPITICYVVEMWRGYSGTSVKLTSQLHPVLRLTMCGAIAIFPNTCAWSYVSFSVGPVFYC
jgi:hypothetical protein